MSRADRPPFPLGEGEIRLGMIGCTAGNGHPYSWSAIFNGYDRDLMSRECPYPVIPDYLNKQPPGTFGLPGVRVTHVSCAGDGGFTAEHVARCSRIPKVVEKPEDLVGKVDAVLIATDIGSEHVRRARPFVEAGIPVFVDKPLVDNEPDLMVFNRWVGDGAPILSSSSMRYAKKLIPFQLSTHELGDLRLITVTSNKKWETYGIHALEAVYSVIGPGFLSARNTGSRERNIVHLRHSRGIDILVAVTADISPGPMMICGTEGHVIPAGGDSFYSFKKQLEVFVDYLRTGARPFPFSETVELMKLVIAGIRSREEGGREITLAEIAP